MSNEPNGTTTGLLSDAIHRGTFGVTVQEHRALKLLPVTEDLRDHMSTEELYLLSFVESLAASLHRERDSQGFNALLKDVTEAGEIGGGVRRLMESALGRPVVSGSNFLGQGGPPEENGE